MPDIIKICSHFIIKAEKSGIISIKHINVRVINPCVSNKLMFVAKEKYFT